MKFGYLIPEWPGSSHVWAWREIKHLRELGLDVALLSTRPPKTPSRHAFAAAASAETIYLWPAPWYALAWDVLAVAARHPVRFLGCAVAAFWLPVHRRPRWLANLPLLAFACRLVRRARRHGIGFLHTPIAASSGLLCWFARRLDGLPYSVTVAAALQDHGGAMTQKLAAAEFVSCVVEQLRQRVLREHPEVSPDRLALTPHGVDVATWQPPPDGRRAGGGPLRVLSIGRLHPAKGHDVLLRAMAQLVADGVAVQLRIAGEGPDRARLDGIVRELGLAAHVTLLGGLGEDECLAEAQAADAFALASRAEAIGVSVLEAMATGLPAVATCVGGIGEYLRDGENALAVPVDDVGAVAKALAALAADPALRARLGAAGRRTVVQGYDSRIGARALADMLTAAARRAS